MTADAGPRIRRPPPAGPALHSPRWLRRIAGDAAEERTTRALAFGFLPGGAVFGLLAGPTAAAQSDAWPALWTDVAFTLGVLPSIALGLCAFLLPLVALRRIALVAVFGALLVQASIPLAILPGVDLNGQAWFLQVCGLGLIATTLAMPPGRAVLVLVLGAVLTFIARQATDGTDAVLQGLQDGAYVLLFTLTFVSLGVSALAVGRAADEAEAGALLLAGGAAAEAARERERTRINALVHDRVLATLLAAARPVPGSAALRRVDAARALEGLREMLREEGPAAAVSAEALVWQLQAVVTEMAPDAGFGYELPDAPDVPGPVAEALLQAVQEALRNSLRHAGSANRTVHVHVDPAGVRVDVLDDGVGFDRAAVPASRLGIAESIEGRMRALPGGRASLITRPAIGTRVVLGWDAP